MVMNNKNTRITNDDFVELCKKGTADEVLKSIATGADVNAKDKDKRTPLCVACVYNNVDAVRILLENGADPNAKFSEDWTILMFIAADDEIDFEIFKMMIDAGADINAKSEYSHTALGRAIQHSGRIDVIKLFLEAGADINVPCPYGADFFEHGGGNALESSIYKPEIFDLILKYGGDINQGNGELLREFAGRGSAKIVKMLLNAGVDVNAKDEYGITPLIAATRPNISVGQTDAADVIKMLLEAGADPNVTYEGMLPLYYARQNHYLAGTDAIKRLEAMTITPDFSEYTSPDSFMEFFKYGSVQEIEAVIKAGADVNAKSRSGGTPLSQVLNYRLGRLYRPYNYDEIDGVKILKILLAAGVDINETPLLLEAVLRDNHYRIKCNYNIIKFLIDNGSDVNIANDNGYTPLMGAAFHRDPEVVRLLLNAGADVNARTKENQTAL